MNLLHGSPLQLEVLDVTLKVVTYTVPRSVTQAQMVRLLRNLQDRDISWTLASEIRPYFFHPRTNQHKLTIGAREYLFMVVL